MTISRARRNNMFSELFTWVNYSPELRSHSLYKLAIYALSGCEDYERG